MSDHKRLGVLYALAATLSVAVSFFFVDYLNRLYDPVTMTVLRYVPVLAFFLFLARKELHKVFTLPKKYWLLPVLAFAGQLTFIEQLKVANIVLADLFYTALAPVTVTILSYLMFKREREHIKDKRFLLGVLAMILGAVVIFLPQGGLSLTPLGLAVLSLNVLIWSVYAVSSKYLINKLGVTASVAFVYSASWVLFVLAFLAQGTPLPEVPPFNALILAVSGVIGVGCVFYFYFQSIRLLGAAMASAVAAVEPVFSMLIAALIGYSFPTPLQLVGGGIMLGGLFLVYLVELPKEVGGLERLVEREVRKDFKVFKKAGKGFLD